MAKFRLKRRRIRRGRTRMRRKRMLYKKRRSFRKRKFIAQRHRIQFMPLDKIVRMRYCDNITMTTTTAGFTNSYLFRPNSIYDPNATGGGHQPTNRDLWMTYYNEYCVIGSRITIRPIRDTNLHPENWYDVYTTESIADLPSTATEMIEFKGKSGVAGSWIDDNRRVKKAYWAANKWFKRKVMSDDNMWTAVNDSPLDVLYFVILLCCPAAANQSIMFNVVIDYTVALRKRLEVNTEN